MGTKKTTLIRATSTISDLLVLFISVGIIGCSSPHADNGSMGSASSASSNQTQNGQGNRSTFGDLAGNVSSQTNGSHSDASSGRTSSSASPAGGVTGGDTGGTTTNSSTTTSSSSSTNTTVINSSTSTGGATQAAVQATEPTPFGTLIHNEPTGPKFKSLTIPKGVTKIYVKVSGGSGAGGNQKNCTPGKAGEPSEVVKFGVGSSSVQVLCSAGGGQGGNACNMSNANFNGNVFGSGGAGGKATGVMGSVIVDGERGADGSASQVQTGTNAFGTATFVWNFYSGKGGGALGGSGTINLVGTNGNFQTFKASGGGSGGGGAAGGGGEAAFCKGEFAVSPGDVIGFTVGAGGVGSETTDTAQRTYRSGSGADGFVSISYGY